MRIPLGAIILGSIVVVSGCSDKGLKQLYSSGTGPEEFSVLPVKPLTEPANYTSLPTPTPGGANLVDVNPKDDAIIALGGRAGGQNAQSIANQDIALVNQAGRYGVPSNTREELALSDAELRKRSSKSIFRFKLGRYDHYNAAYKDQSLDAYAETERFRRGGALTPSSPPASK